jgi:hypothetical protein
VCSNDIGICCPTGVVCGEYGKCPVAAVANAGFTIGDSGEVETYVQDDGEHIMDNDEESGDGVGDASSEAPAASASSD